MPLCHYLLASVKTVLIRHVFLFFFSNHGQYNVEWFRLMKDVEGSTKDQAQWFVKQIHSDFYDDENLNRVTLYGPNITIKNFNGGGSHKIIVIGIKNALQRKTQCGNVLDSACALKAHQRNKKKRCFVLQI